MPTDERKQKEASVILCAIELFVLITLSLAGGIIGYRSATRSMEREAVQHGAAEWTVDEDGNRVFKWREAK